MEEGAVGRDDERDAGRRGRARRIIAVRTGLGRSGKTAILAIVACAGPDAVPPAMPRVSYAIDAPLASVVEPDAPPDAAIDAPQQVAVEEVWLKGSTHVHAK